MDKYQKIFKNLPENTAPEELYGKILFAVDEKRKADSKIRFAIFGFLLLTGILAMIPAWQNLYQSLLESGTWDMVTLFVTNTSQVAGVWQDFLISLIEYMPVLSLVIFLSVLLLSIYSLGSSLRYAKVMFNKFI